MGSPSQSLVSLIFVAARTAWCETVSNRSCPPPESKTGWRQLSRRRLARMAPFDDMFTAPTWQRVLVLLIGAVLSPGRRTMAAALRGTGLDQDPHFLNDHRVLRRSGWPSRRVAQCLFSSLVNTFVPSGPVIIGLDDTRNDGGMPRSRRAGVYRDPAWSSHGRFLVTDMNAGERRNARGFAYTNANAADSK
jgi:hypothetical protein